MLWVWVGFYPRPGPTCPLPMKKIWGMRICHRCHIFFCPFCLAWDNWGRSCGHTDWQILWHHVLGWANFFLQLNLLPPDDALINWGGFVTIARWMWGTVVRWLSWWLRKLLDLNRDGILHPIHLPTCSLVGDNWN